MSSDNIGFSDPFVTTSGFLHYMKLVEEKDMAIRKMEDTPEEYERMLKWLTNPSVREWYDSKEGLTLEAIREKYRSRILGESYVQPAIIEWENTPVGYLQFYETQKEKEYNIKEPILEESNVWAMDIFIGESDALGKGIGSSALRLMLRYLFEQKAALKVIIDPDVRNERAIRAYEKAGFKKLKILKHWEKHGDEWTDAWLMVYEK